MHRVIFHPDKWMTIIIILDDHLCEKKITTFLGFSAIFLAFLTVTSTIKKNIWIQENRWIDILAIYTLFEIFIFVQKFNFDFPRKLSIFSGWKTRENVVVFDFLAFDNFDFTRRKIVKKKIGRKTRQNFLSNLTFRMCEFAFNY